MKHIKKKFEFERPVNSSIISELSDQNKFISLEKVKEISSKKMESHQPFLVNEKPNGEYSLIDGFFYRFNDKSVIFPEPDPVLIYFHNAWINAFQFKEKKERLISAVDSNRVDESILSDFYIFFGITMGFVTSLFTCMEAFINKKIPEDFLYQHTFKKETKRIGKEEIQRFLPFKEKMGNLMEEITGKNFKTSFKQEHGHILKLKKFRDQIIHTKESTKPGERYEYLFKQSLDYDYIRKLKAVFKYVNFFEPGYIEECNCGNNDFRID